MKLKYIIIGLLILIVILFGVNIFSEKDPLKATELKKIVENKLFSTSGSKGAGAFYELI